jgi:TetR/AcrR family transcriptional regulator, fatty acid metabolism regulator protein
MNSHSVPVTAPRSAARVSLPTPSSRRPAGASVVRAVADKRERILRAAIKTFARRGFFNAQVADVARAAGVASGTVYLYFRSKDDLLASIFERTMRGAIAEGRAALEGLDPETSLRRIARLHLERLGADRDLAVVFQVELRGTTKFMERFSATYVREYLGIIRDVITHGQARRVFRAEMHPTLVAKALFGALDEMATNWVLSRRTYDLAADADPIVDLILHGARTARKP